ncbi:hypothetical protein Aci022_141 [Acinetobacter phage vB_AbaM_B09_Aci02-2]|uniref:Uncharacterized protein n=1 Tax=Acinetobacter phage vB_AbaM_B09_Aci02-2 TaxID=2315467 RepID=A0A386KKD3_9CAUD|nr:hypothetical protein HOU30_gp049 [Acinetobacter phage vB_AbaM_B09_Aci02-2]AYD85810.1 hypothetical protein Aci022_141 [Acinetobacter phage vB_AbaM_B09_Aci02-2]
MKLFLVINEKAGECIGFNDLADAQHAATGKNFNLEQRQGWHSVLGSEYRESIIEDEDEQFRIAEVEIDLATLKNAEDF